MLGSYNKILLTFDEHALWICVYLCGKEKRRKIKIKSKKFIKKLKITIFPTNREMNNQLPQDFS